MQLLLLLVRPSVQQNRRLSVEQDSLWLCRPVKQLELQSQQVIHGKLRLKQPLQRSKQPNTVALLTRH